MVGPLQGSLITLAALALFAAIGVRAAVRYRVGDRDRYLTARATQGSRALALSFFASALGAWILFAPPEVGTFAGLLGILGYAVGQAAAIGAYAWLGPRVRAAAPSASTVLDFVRERFGRTLQVYVAAVAVLYMFVFLTAELTAVGGVSTLLTGADPLVAIVAVAAVTAAYTAYGGLPASLETDRWQAWLVLGLGLAAVVALFGDVANPGERAAAGGAFAVSRTGLEVGIVLVIAIVAANLFHQGFWQRVWASRDDESLRRGAMGGAALIVPVVFLMGVAGAVAGPVEAPSLAFFSLLEGSPTLLLAGVLALGVALVASSVDTLQNGLTSLAAAHTPVRSLGAARAITVVLTIPAAAIAVQGHSVLRLFLIADLLAATVAFPVFLGLWRRVTPAAALSGAVAGVLGVVVAGWVQTGGLVQGALLLTLPDGPSLAAFVAAPVASLAVTLGMTALVRGSAVRTG